MTIHLQFSILGSVFLNINIKYVGILTKSECYFHLFVETGSQDVDQAGLGFIQIPLPLPPDYFLGLRQEHEAWNHKTHACVLDAQ